MSCGVSVMVSVAFRESEREREDQRDIQQRGEEEHSADRLEPFFRSVGEQIQAHTQELRTDFSFRQQLLRIGAK